MGTEVSDKGTPSLPILEAATDISLEATCSEINSTRTTGSLDLVYIFHRSTLVEGVKRPGNIYA